jgi:hypothetical protein
MALDMGLWSRLQPQSLPVVNDDTAIPQAKVFAFSRHSGIFLVLPGLAVSRIYALCRYETQTL